MTLYENPANREQISGYVYVPAKERKNESNVFKLHIVSSDNCNHETTVCTGYLPKDDNSLASLIKSGISCVESWELDWELLFRRTSGGRTLAERVGRELE
jgi:hypothetical protein